MKKRPIEILKFILENPKISFNTVLDSFSVSKRTLYYDIESINNSISSYGHVAIINQELVFIGDFETLKNSSKYFVETKEEYISFETLFYELLRKPINEVASRFDLTINEIQKQIEKNLKSKHRLENNIIVGNERELRNEFIRLMHHDNNILNSILEVAIVINNELNLNLSDYSLSFLSEMIHFVKLRIQQNQILQFDWLDESDIPPYYDRLNKILNFSINSETRYICAYVLSLSTVNVFNNHEYIYDLTSKLVLEVSIRTNTNYTQDTSFTENLYIHLLSSYYRIKYQFPIINVLLENVKSTNMFMFCTIKQVFRKVKELKEFSTISDDEIAFVTIYFESYGRRNQMNSIALNRVLIVCPFGLMISKSIESQLLQYIPGIDIVGTISIQEIESFNKPYDLIVTTSKLNDVKNQIMVKPILSREEISKVYKEIYRDIKLDVDYQKLLNLISKSSTVHDSQKLVEDLYLYFNPRINNQTKPQEEYPMLSELINESRVNTVVECPDWQSAIRLASQPLLEQECIEESYVTKMIEAIKEYGPYVILADGFAMPHANNSGDVNELSVSLLRLENELDFLGQPVSTIMVLATIDSESHLKALSSLAELLYEPENLKVFTEGSTQEILDLIRSNDQTKEVSA